MKVPRCHHGGSLQPRRGAAWPIWQYVVAKLFQQHHLEAAPILAGTPRVTVRQSIARYGWFRMSSMVFASPQPVDTIALSISCMAPAQPVATRTSTGSTRCSATSVSGRGSSSPSQTSCNGSLLPLKAFERCCRQTARTPRSGKLGLGRCPTTTSGDSQRSLGKNRQRGIARSPLTKTDLSSTSLPSSGPTTR